MPTRIPNEIKKKVLKIKKLNGKKFDLFRIASKDNEPQNLSIQLEIKNTYEDSRQYRIGHYNVYYVRGLKRKAKRYKAKDTMFHTYNLKTRKRNEPRTRLQIKKPWRIVIYVQQILQNGNISKTKLKIANKTLDKQHIGDARKLIKEIVEKKYTREQNIIVSAIVYLKYSDGHEEEYERWRGWRTELKEQGSKKHRIYSVINLKKQKRERQITTRTIDYSKRKR